MGNTFTDGTTASGSTLITLTQSKAYAGITSSDDDTTLNTFLEAITGLFENHCSRRLIAATVTEYLDGTGTDSLYLPEPARSVSSIYVDSNRLWTSGDEIEETDDDGAPNWRLNTGRDGTGRQVEYFDSIWTYDRKNIKVTFAAGYATIPDAVQRAAKVQFARMVTEWKRAKREEDNLLRQDVDGWDVEFMARIGVDPEAQTILAPYVNHWMA